MGKRAQRIPSWPGVIHSNKGRIHLRRPTCDILTFRLRRSGGPYIPVRLIAIAMSAGFFLYLIWRSGPSKLWKSLAELGWGIILVIALAGVSHLARTWGWRLTLGDDQHKISFSRLVGLR